MKIFLISIFVLVGGSLWSQSCVELEDNVLCADSNGIQDTLISSPLGIGCFNSQMTYYSTFHTGPVPGGNVRIEVIPGDCDDFTGPNQIFTAVFLLPPGADPCNPLEYVQVGGCFGDDVAYVQQINGLNTDSDFLVVVGTDHLPEYGPCEFDISITGTAVDISTNVSPFLVYLGGTAELNAYNASDYSWSPPDYLSDTNIFNPESTPEITTEYTVQGTIGECTVYANATVTVGPPIIVYTGLTPNGDGINDFWVIQGVERFESAIVSVYDRWGQLVFKSTGYAKPWDGTNKGKSLPMAAYYYVIELNSLEVEIPPITGVISILK